MNLIVQNPFRVIGVWANAGQRDLARQRARVQAFQRVGKSISFEEDLTFLAPVQRSEEELNRAFSSIELHQKKINYALFWFVNIEPYDEIALEHLKSGCTAKAEEIWQKIVGRGAVTTRNYSAFNNLGTLLMSKSISNGHVDLNEYGKGVTYKISLIQSDLFDRFCYEVAGETYLPNQHEQLNSFIRIVVEEVEAMQAGAGIKLGKTLQNLNTQIEDLITVQLTEDLLLHVERKISRTKELREENPEEGVRLAHNLWNETKQEIEKIREVLGWKNVKYKIIADKLSKEILQCGIDCFKAWSRNEDKYHGILGDDVMKVFKIAKSLAVGSLVTDRIAENINGLQEWIDNAEERRKQQIVESEVDFIFFKLNEFKLNVDSTIEATIDFVDSCKPKLFSIRAALGRSETLYLEMSSVVAFTAMQRVVEIVNEMQKDVPVMVIIGLVRLESIITKAISAFEKISELDMLPDLRKKFEMNYRTLLSIASQLGIRTRTSRKNPSGFMKGRVKQTVASRRSNDDSTNFIGWLFAIIVILATIATCNN